VVLEIILKVIGIKLTKEKSSNNRLDLATLCHDSCEGVDNIQGKKSEKADNQ
jgi:hypothetical protein